MSNYPLIKELGLGTELLINVKPIVKDTAESLLREVMQDSASAYLNMGWLSRAKRLLEQK